VTLRAGVALALAAAPVQARNVVLVQDAVTDDADWAAVIPLLEAAGLAVDAVAHPTDSLTDPAEVRRVLALQEGPVVLVGHGLGGAVMSQAGSDPKVSALVYVAASAPDSQEGSSDLALLSQPAQGKQKSDAAAWREKPTFYAVSQQDTAIPADLQRLYAARMKAKTIVLDAGTLSMESHPREIAGLILEAAGMKPAACGAEGDDGSAACAAPALPRSLAEGCKCTKTPLEDLTAP
jgi:pimeloyl-ACP methyl ester carboxylesterase